MAHRHLIGINSPPNDHEPDNNTLGLDLPRGWDGDAWKREAAGSTSYWLRAWNKGTERFAIAQAEEYEAARKLLLQDIETGGSGKAILMIAEQNG